MVIQLTENLMGSKLDPSFDFFYQEDPTGSISVIQLTDRETDSHENNTSLVEVMIHKSF